MDKRRLRIMVEISLMVGAATLLSFLRLFRMPYGGSVTFEMLPILVLAFRWGGKIGILGGAIHGLLGLLFGPSFVHPIQILLDYPVPYAAVGLAGAGVLRNNRILGTVVGSLARYIVHVTAGAVFWGHYAPAGTSAVAYSLIYNAYYLVPEMILMLVLIHLLGRREEIFQPELGDA